MADAPQQPDAPEGPPAEQPDAPEGPNYELMPPDATLRALDKTKELDRPLHEYPEALRLSGSGGLRQRAEGLNGRYLRSPDERRLGAPVYRSRGLLAEQADPLVDEEGCGGAYQIYRALGGGGAAWYVWGPGQQSIRDGMGSRAALPQDVQRWRGHSGVLDLLVEKTLGPAVPVLRIADRELLNTERALPLHEVGLAAECAVEVLNLHAAEGVEPAPEGPLTVFASAPSLGCPDPIALELDPEATVGGLLAAYARQCPQAAEAAAAAAAAAAARRSAAAAAARAQASAVSGGGVGAARAGAGQAGRSDCSLA